MHDPHRKELHPGPPAATGWSDVPDAYMAPADPTVWQPRQGSRWLDDLFHDPNARPGDRASRLAGLRCEQMEAVLDRLAAGGRPVRVAVYALAAGDKDPGPDLAAARRWAQSQPRWSVVSWHVDATGPAVPLSQRSGWYQARAAVSGGFAHGLVTVNRGSLVGPDDHDDYQLILDWFVNHGAFLAHVPVGPEVAGC